MKIIIEGSPKELAKLAAVLNGAAIAEKKAEIPPLLTELADDEKRNKMANDIQRALAKTTETGRGKENAPQAETAEQDITFASIKPRFEACIKRIKEANSGEENAPQAETAETKLPVMPFFV